MNQTSDEHELARTLGTNARAVRISRGLTQEHAAEKIGISADFYGLVERGYALPSVMTLRRMAMVLETPASWLLGLTRPDKPN